MAWTNPTTRTTGTLITAAIWNTDLVDNLSYLKSSPVIDTAVTLGAATTSGIRLDLESGTLAVREGDDSAYGPINTGALTVASGRALVGTTTARTLTTLDSLVQVETAGSTYQQLSLVANRNDTGGASLILGKSRGTAVNSNTIVADGDNVGFIGFNAADGVDMDSNVAQILAQIDGTPGSNNTPGRLIFSTTAESAATLTEAVRIDNRQNLGIGVTPSAWGTQYDVQAIELKSGALWNYSTTNIYLGQNYYYNGMLRIYETTAAASEYMQGSGEHYFYTAPSGTAGNVIALTERMRIDNGGRIGIGVTPTSTWDTASSHVLQMNGGSLWSFSTSQINIVQNLSYDGTNFKYVNTAASSAYRQISGDHQFHTAPSGTAANTATLTERFRVLNGGNIAIGATAKLFLDGVTGAGNTYITESSADVIRMYTGGTDRFVLSTTQCYINLVYSQTTASAANVNVASDGLLARSTSSIRYKHDIDTLDSDQAMAAVMAMRPVTYRGKTDTDQRRFVGFIAEEMQEIAPLLCSYDEGGESGTPNYVTYDRVTAYLVAVVQQQQAKIAALEARLN